jgi:tetratricopeptide (TPR) repeat protein
MTADISPGQPPLPAGLLGSRRRRVALAVVLLAGGAAWWWSRGSADQAVGPAAIPPLPAEVQDPEVKQAVETARAKVLAAPAAADAWGHYGMVLLAHSFGPEADECLARAGELNPADPRWPYGRAVRATNLGPPDDAPEHFRRTIALGDREYRSAARFGLADVLLANGQTEPAAELFREEFGAEPGHPRAALGLGQIALANGDEATATRLLTSARNDPHAHKQAAALLANLARRRGDAAAARAFEAESNEAAPRPWPDPFLNQMVPLMVGIQGRKRRIDTFERQGKYAAAQDEYVRLLALERSPKTLARAATNSARLGNFPEAVARAREARERDPTDATTHYTLALVLYTGFENDVARNPDVTGAADACREVVAAARHAVELKSDHARAYLLWGLALKHLGDLKGAQEQIRKGLGFRADDVELLFGLGQVLAAAGDTNGAVAAFEEAKKVKPSDRRAARALDKLRGR